MEEWIIMLGFIFDSFPEEFDYETDQSINNINVKRLWITAVGKVQKAT